MPNTSLPTNVAPGSTGHIGHANIVHEEINRLSQDTGLRDVTSLLVNGWKVGAGGYVRIRRVNDLVTLFVNRLDGRDSTNRAFLDAGNQAPAISLNMFPKDNQLSALFKGSSDTATEPWNMFTSGNSFWLSQQILTGNTTVSWTFQTDRAKPSFLPGTAVA